MKAAGQLELELYSRKLPVSPEFVTAYAGRVRALLGSPRLSFLVSGADESEVRIPLESVTETLITETFAEGGVVLRDEGGSDFNCLIEPDVYFHAVRLGVGDFLLRDPKFHPRLLRFVEELAELGSADLLFVGQSWNNVAYRATDASIADGLRDTYWINVYGPEFVEMLGEAKLLSSPCAEARALLGGRILVRLSDTIDCDLERAAFREYLGEEFFVPEPKRSKPVRSGNLFVIARHLWRLSREEPTPEVAPRRPYFKGVPPTNPRR